MNLWFRLTHVVIASLWAARLPLDGEGQLSFRVWPSDLDINLHMTNSRYLALMDLGRVSLIFRCGLWPVVRRDRLAPLVAGTMIRFRRPLKPFQKFTVISRCLGWDAKWLYFEHKILSGENVAAHAIAKTAFLGKDGTVAPDQLAADIGFKGVSPVLPEWIADWQAADEAAMGRKVQP